MLIVDWDVHHGNGTQHSFEDDPSVLFFSTHQYPHYPGTGRDTERGKGAGEGFTVNVPMEAGEGDEAYHAIFLKSFVPAADAFKPEFVIISAGFDAHKDDPLAGMGLTEAGYADLTEIVAGIARTPCERPHPVLSRRWVQSDDVGSLSGCAHQRIITCLNHAIANCKERHDAASVVDRYRRASAALGRPVLSSSMSAASRRTNSAGIFPEPCIRRGMSTVIPMPCRRDCSIRISAGLNRPSRLGINQDSDVVIYSNPFDNWGDEGRMFWMLEYLGHKRLRILDGGWVKWTAEKRPFEHGPVSPSMGHFKAQPVQALIALKDELKGLVKGPHPQTAILDARSVEEYLGKEVSGLPRSGHIPSAIHVAWKGFLQQGRDRQGFLRDQGDVGGKGVRRAGSYLLLYRWRAIGMAVFHSQAGRVPEDQQLSRIMVGMESGFRLSPWKKM